MPVPIIVVMLGQGALVSPPPPPTTTTTLGKVIEYTGQQPKWIPYVSVSFYLFRSSSSAVALLVTSVVTSDRYLGRCLDSGAVMARPAGANRPPPLGPLVNTASHNTLMTSRCSVSPLLPSPPGPRRTWPKISWRQQPRGVFFFSAKTKR